MVLGLAGFDLSFPNRLIHPLFASFNKPWKSLPPLTLNKIPIGFDLGLLIGVMRISYGKLKVMVP